MSDQAIILIPDISGFTDFTSATEIDHSAHIITELLELIIASNETGFTLAEIEGDRRITCGINGIWYHCMEVRLMNTL